MLFRLAARPSIRDFFFSSRRRHTRGGRDWSSDLCSSDLTRESAALAHKLIAATCTAQGITGGQLTIHADRGSSMTSKPVTFLLADLGVIQSHSRPHVSNRSEEHTSELQSRLHLVCRLLLE